MKERDPERQDLGLSCPSSEEARAAPLRVCIVGLGRVGLPLAALLADRGHRVHGVDVDLAVLAGLRAGVKRPRCEAGLEDAIDRALSASALSVSAVARPADAFVVAVPTPLASRRQADLDHVNAAVKAIAPVLEGRNLVVLESTVPVGTTHMIAENLRQMRPDLHGRRRLYVAHCPERVLPGRTLTELVDNDRIVGGVDPESTARALRLYRSFVRGNVVGTNARTAELTKLAENAYRDVNIAYANELSMICGELGVDVREVIGLANRHPRVHILDPGPGVGGHCVPVDPWFLAGAAPRVAALIPTARAVNEEKARWIVRRVLKEARGFPSPTVACLGLTYKADLDDLRESPALGIARELHATEGIRVLAADPYVTSAPDVTLMDADAAIAQADIVAALVGHRAFRELPRAAFGSKVLVDACGLFP